LKRIFEGCLSPQISSKSLSPKRDGALKKKEKKYWKKRERERKKKNLQESLQIKREVNILRG
jgi:hypothetical protein